MTEGSGDGLMRFPVRLDRASGRTVTVQYATANGTATAGTDYTRATGRLTFAAGTTVRTTSPSSSAIVGETATYVVHCLPEGFPDVRILKKTAGVCEDLMLLSPKVSTGLFQSKQARDAIDAPTRVRRPAMIMVMLALLIAAKADDWQMTVDFNEGTGQMNT